LEHNPDHSFSDVQHRPTWSLKKIALTVFLSALLFGAGVAMGRGDVKILDLSKPRLVIGSNSELDYSTVDEVYRVLQNDFDGNLDRAKLIDGLKSGLVSAAGDPYTEYFSPKEAKDFNDQLKGSITGIGAELGTNNNNIVIVSPLAGFPADKAGLKPKDIVAAVDGKATTGMSVSSVVQKIRGKEGTTVTLAIIRDGGNPFNVTIARQKITVPSVKYQIDGNIGYMKINQFTDDTTKLAQNAAQEFKSAGVKGIILDVRGNPGGYLSASTDIASLWLDEGKTVVQQKRGNKIVGTQKASGNNLLKGIPTIVLIDEGSASASEILAGALNDNLAATLVGQKSFGKGSVQQVENLSGGSEIKVTIARWYTPLGKNIDNQGIKPEIQVLNDEASVTAGKDPQKDKAYEILKAKI
jgi:carboxyl-terminal processing protease